MRIRGTAGLLCSAMFIMICALMAPQRAVARMSIQQERELGIKLLRMIESQVQMVKDPEAIEYVTSVGQKILSVVHGKYFHYRFFIIDDEALNAFAIPGGLVFVHSGLLMAIDSEDELACVLAHEIGHVQGRHIARHMDRMKAVNIGTAALALAGLFLGSSQAGSAVLTSSLALNASISLKYSREDEEEADRRAFQWLCQAGFDPRGLVTVLKKMQRNRFLGSDAIPSYLSTHPGTSQRITYLEDLWKGHPCRERVKEDPFLLKRIQIKLTVLTGDAATLISRYSKEVKREPGNWTSLYGLALSQLAFRDYNESIGSFKRLISLVPGRPRFRIDLARAYFESGQYRESIHILSPYYDKNPQDEVAGFYLAQAYLELGQPQRALPIFKRIETGWPAPASLYFQMGGCYAAMNMAGEAHYYFYKYYKLLPDVQAANYHRQKALELLPRDSELYKEIKSDTKSINRENTSWIGLYLHALGCSPGDTTGCMKV